MRDCFSILTGKSCASHRDLHEEEQLGAEFAWRFLIGGLVVSAFSFAGDLIRPQSLAGVFGAAPSVALATLGMAVAGHGGAYAALEERSMLVGAVALACYNLLVGRVLIRKKWHAWLALSAGLWWFYQWLKDQRRTLRLPRREPARKTTRATEARP